MSIVYSPDRRQFLVTSAAAGAGFLLAFSLASCARSGSSDKAGGTGFRPNGWLRITPDNRITVLVDEAEMGQGVHTSLPMLVAEELEVDLTAIQVEQAPVENAVYGWQYTAGSTSIREGWERFRRAGAVAREMLLAAAAQSWGVPKGECKAISGEVVHEASGHRASYGELATVAAGMPLPEHVHLKEPGAFRIIGKSMPRVDGEKALNGSAVFGIDVQLPDLLTATVVHPPVYGGRVQKFDAAKALASPGVREVVEIDSGVAVVADHFWAAKKGAELLEIQWDLGPNADLSSESILQLFNQHAESHANKAEERIAAAMKEGGQRFEAEYQLPFQAHAALEPMCCTVHIHDGICEVWVPSQAPSDAQIIAGRFSMSRVEYLIQRLKGKLLGRSFDSVKVHNTLLGGGFGRRLENDYVVEAVQIAKAVDAPVKLIWTREEDIRHDFFRPASLHRMTAGIDDEGMPVAWHQLAVGVSAYGAPYYRIPVAAADSVELETGVPTGPWRSVSHSWNAFVIESFIDELAVNAGRDPVEYRLRLLAEQPRLKAVVEKAAEKANWGGSLPEGHFQGIAAHPGFGSQVAQVVELSVSRSKGIRIHRIVCVIDCGMVVNPDMVVAQMEGGIIFGLTATLTSAITIRGGCAEQSNYWDFPILKIGETPPIEVYVMPSDEPPGGVGEPGVPPVAPAVVNALHAATGTRIRKLPVTIEDLFE